MKIIPLLLLLVSCTPLTEEQIEAREYELVEAQEYYRMFAIECSGMGGTPLIEMRGGLSRKTAHDYRSAKCVRF